MTFPKWRIATMIRQRNGTTMANSTADWPRSLRSRTARREVRKPSSEGSRTSREAEPSRGQERSPTTRNGGGAIRSMLVSLMCPGTRGLRNEVRQLLGDIAEEVVDP